MSRQRPRTENQIPNTSSNMAEAFLQNLLQQHKSIQNEDQRCAICLEGYGTISLENGTLEVEMRLPCNHTVGSACIAQWLKDRNSCPICRREFFPAQPRPYLEHGVMDSEEIDRAGDPRNIRELNEEYCAQLGLDEESGMVSWLVVQNVLDSGLLRDVHTDWCIVSVAMYMASHLIGEPRSPREIAAITGVEADHIRATYDAIYGHREELADVEVLCMLEEVFAIFEPLRWPAPGYEATDEQIEREHVWQMLREGCGSGCAELGLGAQVVDFAYHIAREIHTVGLIDHITPRETVAVGIYMASHMIREPFRPSRVAEAVGGVSASRVCEAYEAVCAHQHGLQGQAWLEEVGRVVINGIPGRLPPPWVSS